MNVLKSAVVRVTLVAMILINVKMDFYLGKK